VIVSLTPAGRPVAEEARTAIAELDHGVAAKLSPTQLGKLLVVLEQLGQA
jgi:DNA-binding MarR family transcriptional regulator